MFLCFITRERTVCRLIIEQMKSKNYICCLQDNWSEFYNSIHNSSCHFNLVICDYSLIGSSGFSIFEEVRSAGYQIPIIFYNDPEPQDYERVDYWINKNEIIYDDFDFPQEYIPVLKRLNDVINNPAIRRHISLLQPPVPVGFSNKDTFNNSIDLYQFRVRNQLSPVMFRLFEYMYNHRSKEIGLMELDRHLFGIRFFRIKKKGNVYSYVSRLRKIIGKDKLVKTEIIRTSCGKYKLVVM